MERSVMSESFNPMVTKLEDLGIDEKHIINEPDVSIPANHFYLYSTLKDYLHEKKLPVNSVYPCFYCTETFYTPPLGIPLEFVSSYIETYTCSEKDGSTLTFKKDLCTKKEIEANKDKNVVYRDYFRVDGNFCSFHCMIAYIKMYPSGKYNDIGYLLKYMHRMIFQSPLKWEAAPDIRTLKKYGGFLTIDEFRSEEGRKYIRSNNYKHAEFKDDEKPNILVPSSLYFSYIGNKLS
jgi:hypothetical protein